MNQDELPIISSDMINEAVNEVRMIEESLENDVMVSRKVGGQRPKLLMVGRDNAEILKNIQENRAEMIASGISIDELDNIMELCVLPAEETWPDPIPFTRLCEDMKSDYMPKNFVEHWTPGQGAPMKHKKKRIR